MRELVEPSEFWGHPVDNWFSTSDLGSVICSIWLEVQDRVNAMSFEDRAQYKLDEGGEVEPCKEAGVEYWDFSPDE